MKPMKINCLLFLVLNLFRRNYIFVNFFIIIEFSSILVAKCMGNVTSGEKSIVTSCFVSTWYI